MAHQYEFLLDACQVLADRDALRNPLAPFAKLPTLAVTTSEEQDARIGMLADQHGDDLLHQP